LKNYWLANYLSVISMLLLRGVYCATMIFHFHFTHQYSREGVESEWAKNAPFLHVNYVSNTVWGIVFTLCFVRDAFL